jgi:murein DD-endopeptidase MepM/ murein hydrolase activator NlpD
MRSIKKYLFLLITLSIFISACAPDQSAQNLQAPELTASAESAVILPAQMPTRPQYSPGEIVSYHAQSGDTIPAVAAHFNTTVEEIRENNPIIPDSATTLPTGLPMQIPIYYEPLWGSSFKILPDSHFVNGPLQKDFDTIAYVNSQAGWLKDYEDLAGGYPIIGGEIINKIAENYSISPKLLLAIIEYQTGAVTQKNLYNPDLPYPLGIRDSSYKDLYQQLIKAATLLNNGYYGWRSGFLDYFEHRDGSLEYIDPWQNAPSAALQYYFGQILDKNEYLLATSGQGLLKTYTDMFGDPWLDNFELLPGSLEVPEMQLPFETETVWAYTGGPHTAWGVGEPFAAIDFAPANIKSGCVPTDQWVTAVAAGTIVRTDVGTAVLDLDDDGYEQTGWAIFHLHLKTDTIPPVGTHLNAGDPIGLPSCEGGKSTGTHVHMARKYNGEWIAAGGTLAFNLSGWQVIDGDEPYEGLLIRYSQMVEASTVGEFYSRISLDW